MSPVILGASVTALLLLAVPLLLKSDGEARVQRAQRGCRALLRSGPGLPAPPFPAGPAPALCPCQGPCPRRVPAPGAARAARQVALLLQRGPRRGGAGRAVPARGTRPRGQRRATGSRPAPLGSRTVRLAAAFQAGAAVPFRYAVRLPNTASARCFSSSCARCGAEGVMVKHVFRACVLLLISGGAR